jgi:predicted PolB exonuclease-like 3'-5' exonuclease
LSRPPESHCENQGQETARLKMTYAVFDIETRIDKQLLKRAFYAADGISDDEAYRRFIEESGKDFAPMSLHIPISIAIGNVGEDFILHSVESLALSDYSEEKLAREFWTRIERFKGCLVTYNGRNFDLPVLELAALRHGIAAPNYFAESNSPRYRYASARHLDLHEYLTNYGAVRIRGGLDLLLKMIGMPGKGAIEGSQVQGLYEAGRMDEIHRYCRSDVIQTYFLFLRVELMRGKIDRPAYERARESASSFLAELELQL